MERSLQGASEGRGKKREQGFIKSTQQEYFCAVLVQTGQLIRELYTVLFKLKGPNSVLASGRCPSPNPPASYWQIQD